MMAAAGALNGSTSWGYGVRASGMSPRGAKDDKRRILALLAGIVELPLVDALTVRAVMKAASERVSEESGKQVQGKASRVLRECENTRR
jgi:hypothetical protein